MSFEESSQFKSKATKFLGVAGEGSGGLLLNSYSDYI